MSTPIAHDLEAFFAGWMALEPEESTTLGLHGGDERLRDVTDAGIDARARFFAEWHARFEAVASRTEPSGLPVATTLPERLDLDAARALCTWETFAHDVLDDAHHNVDWSLYPFTMAVYARTQGVDVRERIAAIPAFLGERERALRAASGRGRRAARATVERVARVEMPGAAAELAAIDAGAAQAMVEHAKLLEREILPRAPESAAIGADEYRFRLRLTGIDDDVAVLEAEAREALAVHREAIVKVASSLDPGVRDFASASAYVRAQQAETLPVGVDPAAHYGDVLARVVAFLEEHRLFHMPALDLGMDTFPQGMRSRGAGSNWPAPLLDRSRRGQFVVHPDPTAHSAAWATVFAIHEAIPGHYLQSEGFRATWSDARAPVRFSCIADDVAIPRGLVRAMTSIEGWAVHAEQTMRLRGFHRGRDLLFAHVSYAIRAVRVLADAGVHTGSLAPEEAVKLLVEDGGMLEANARAEVARYGRFPVQALTYFVGERQTSRLSEAWMRARGSSADIRDFHAWLFSGGPVPPATLLDHVGEALA